MCGAIRARLAEKYGAEIADAVRIQYGGSVKAANIASIMAQPDVDGALVGGASLDAEEFASIVRFSRTPGPLATTHGARAPVAPGHSLLLDRCGALREE